jgi:hypothetical protein
MALIDQAGIRDAFDLDTAGQAAIEKALASGTRAKPAGQGPKPLLSRSDEDMEYLAQANMRVMQQRHNRMTNRLLAICSDAGFRVEQGTHDCLFDALIRHYENSERHLLVEVKTDTSQEFCRMAIGQLLDYRRHFPDRAAIDMAVLLPESPPTEARDFIHDVGAQVIWFEGDKIRGDDALVFSTPTS